MPRLGLGLGLSLPRPIFLGGGGIPSEPTGFVAKYTAYLVDNFTLVTGDSVSTWDDESVNANNLTQATSINQPTLVENDLVTQFTASDQPTWDGTNLVFASDSAFNVDTNSGEGYTLVFHTVSTEGFVRDLMTSSGTDARIRMTASNGIAIRVDDGTQYGGGLTSLVGNNLSHLVKEGDEIRFYNNGTILGTYDITGKTFTVDRLGNPTAENASINGDVLEYTKYNRVLSASEITNYATTKPSDPLFTYDGYNSSAMRTSANVQASIGDNVAKWYADEHNPYENEVLFDASDDKMGGLPSVTGDWSYVLDVNIKTLGTTKYFLQESGGNSAILALSDNYMYLRDTTGTNDIALTSYTLTTERTQFAFVRSGNDLLYYVNGSLEETVDVTGRTFTFGDVGASVDSADAGFKQINSFDRALTADEVAYYSYLRDENNNILIPPLLPEPPIAPTIYNVNSATLNGTSQALSITNGNSSIEPDSTDFSMGAWVKGSDTTTLQMIFNRYDAGAVRGFDVYIETSFVNFRIESSGSAYSIYTIPATALIDGNLNHLTCNWNQSTQDFAVHVNNSAVATTLKIKSGTVNLNFENRALSFGYREATANFFFDGYMSFGYWKNSAITNAERTELYGNGTPPCFDDISFSLDGAWNLCNYNGNTGTEGVDQSGNGNNLTEIGSPTYTDQGLQVECI